MNLHPAQARRKGAQGRRRWLLALLFAAIGHALFVVLLLALSLVEVHLPGGRGPKIDRPVVMRPMTNEQWLKNRGANAPPPEAATPPKLSHNSPAEQPKPKPDQTPKGQVVDVAPGNNQEDPNAKYLAESSNKTKKESRAKEQTAFYRNAMPKRTTTAPREGNGQDDVESPQVAGNNGMGQDDRPLAEPGDKKSVVEIPDVKERQQIALRDQSQGPGVSVSNQEESEAVQGNSKRLRIAPGSSDTGEEASSGHAGQPGVANLLPSSAVLDKLSGAAANDHLDDVEEGDGTYLNTKEWKYASFFNRVKQSVGMHWEPSSTLRQRDPTGQIFGGRDRYTLVSVTLTDQGHLKDIYVEKSCGLDFLDLEAVKSFERAQPFPNPPPGLVASDSTVKFSFGFFIDMGGGPRMRLFRSAN